MTVAFLLTFAYATVLGIGSFAPMLGATMAVIIGAAFLFKSPMEG